MDTFASVVIPIFNNLEGLSQTLAALGKQSYPSQSYEVIVVDNASTENVEKIAARFPQVKFDRESTPGSYMARNRGIELAKGEILAFTDSDCIPNPNWLANGVKELMSVDRCGLVAGKINFFYQNPQKPTAVELYDSATFLNQKKYVREHQYGVTANLFAWKSTFAEVGNFNSSIKSGGDKEWGKRVANGGYQLLYAEDVCISHPARFSWQEISQKIARTRIGGYEVDRDSTQNKLLFYGRKLITILWRLKPPTKSVLEKLNNLDYPLTAIQKTKLIAIATAIHYQGALVELKTYFKNLRYIF